MFGRSVCGIIQKIGKLECSVAYRSGATTGFLETLKTTRLFTGVSRIVDHTKWCDFAKTQRSDDVGSCGGGGVWTSFDFRYGA